VPLNQAKNALLYVIFDKIMNRNGNDRTRGKCPPLPINPDKITIAIYLTPFLYTFMINFLNLLP
jgi:hypothetical protein